MDKLIPLINRVQDVLTTLRSDMIDLPQIVVVGAQSSGKSSVLEAIVGRDFLPRGQGIVTRRPLILQLVHHEAAADDPLKAWGEFLHDKDKKKFTDFNEIRQEIEAETSRNAGDNKGVSPHPINLKIYDPNVLTLTLVDLPGMTKNPVGDQPADIDKQIRKMCYTYIEKPTALILAVSAANQDLANSDGLQLARMVDPEGYRTLGVLTKLDLMDRGTNAYDVLSNAVIPLRLGFVGVVNRAQADINDNVTIETGLQNEQKFFVKHPVYAEISHRLGTPYLARRLNELLVEHIKRCLPDLRQRVSSELNATLQQLAQMGEKLPDDESKKSALILGLITKFSADFKSTIDGNTSNISTQELVGGARISYIFHELFFNNIEKLDASASVTDDEIRTIIRNTTGTRANFFVPDSAFEVLIKRSIEKLRTPALECVSHVYQELAKVVAACVADRGTERFNVLRDRLQESVYATLQKCLKPAKNMVNNLVLTELAYINTRHPDFVRAMSPEGVAADMAERGYEAVNEARANQPDKMRKAAVAAAQAAPEERKSSGGFFGMFSGSKVKSSSAAGGEPPAVLRTEAPPDPAERMQIQMIRRLLDAYFPIVKKNIQDGVPKAIMYFLVNMSKEQVQSELVQALYRQEMFHELLQENEELTMRRNQALHKVEVLRRTDAILNELRDYRLPLVQPGAAGAAPAAAAPAAASRADPLD